MLSGFPQTVQMTDDKTIEILGIRIYAGDIESFVNHVKEVITESHSRENRCISATGAHGIITAKKNPVFRSVLNEFYANLPDGMPGVWVGRLKSAKKIKRCYGPDFFAAMMHSSSKRDIKHFLCGGAEGVAEQLKQACEKKFNNRNIVGTYCPPFKKVKEYDYQAIAQQINASGADIVWVGISTPKQEQFAYRLSEYTDVHFLATVGAAFDFHIGRVRQAPGWMQKLGLEWFFRLSVEPGRLYKRYFEIVPKFVFYSVIDVTLFYFRNTFSRKES